MLDVYSLKNYLSNNEDKLYLVLEKIGFEDISDEYSGGIEFRCAWEEGSNPTAVRVNKETLHSQCFSRNIKGDIITLVQEKLHCTFTQAIKKISNIVEFNEEEQIEYELPFGGFFRDIKKLRQEHGTELTTYPESILNQFKIIPNRMFLEDGITCDIQEKYKLGYDIITNRIVIPWRDVSGQICGLMGRLNKYVIEDWESKYLPIIPFPKSKTLFGFSDNYKHIQEKSGLFLFESEKSPMIMEAKGVNTTSALGGSNLSEYQANNIKSLFPKLVIVCMDEGLEEEHSREIAKQLKMDTFFQNTVGYIYDSNNLILPKGSKMSPADLPKEDFNRLVKNHVKWI